MPLYSYRCMDANGRTTRGSMDASNLLDLENRLKRMELDLIDCRQVAKKVISTARARISRRDLINFCFHMEQLTHAGVPILEGLRDLRDTVDDASYRGIVADLIENIESGMQLSEAMERHPHSFNKTFTSLVAAGEHSGKLPEVLRRLSDNLKWQDELVAQAKKIVRYPLFVGTVVLGVTFFLMIYLVPQLTGFIVSMGQELPFHTRALIFVSDIFIHFWYAILAVPLVTFAAVKVTLAGSATARYRADGLKLRLPGVGPVLQKIILARFASFFALMYASGITVLDCLRLSEDIVGNAVVAEALRKAGRLIAEGQGVTAAFENVGIFPPLVVRMLKVGEATGSVDEAMRNVSYFYDREIQEMIGKVQSMIEPVMTVVLGMLLAWIMLSVLGPIYDTISKIKT
ncbi:MAG TPA: type II secretion system F family protein [Noviherbaspirillum sp.]|jgi:type IV pilus assembly protein PilC|uniref:type II secretion system F family protein n=1 Tax=Noviherbaspirillum sp. TaxID=1926288 RepID=UPI002F930426